MVMFPRTKREIRFNDWAWTLGKTAMIDDKGENGRKIAQPLSFPVKVLAHKMAYGRIFCQVTPVGGTGRRWINVEKLRFPQST